MKTHLLIGISILAVGNLMVRHTAEIGHIEHNAGFSVPMAPLDHHPHAASAPVANAAVTFVGDTTSHQEYEIRWPTGTMEKLGLVVIPGRPTANS